MYERELRDIDAFIKRSYDGIFRDIAALVAINSVCGEPEPAAPFGRGPAEALSAALDIAARLGLETGNCENMIGYAQTGRGADYIATITHLDVVPAGGGWSQDPFEMTEREGYIIGRGVADDKGPSVLCLYALKYLSERGVPLRYPVRALLGVNEETAMADVTYYLKNYPAPLFCFSPDAGFPVCNGEKGILHGSIVSHAVMTGVVELSGGIARNAVPDSASALVRAELLESRGRVTATPEGAGLWRLSAAGVGGHASTPESSVNAIGVLVDYILDSGVTDGEERDFFRFLRLLHQSTDGSALGVAADDGRFSPLTIIGGTIELRDGRVVQSFDCRYPTNTDSAAICARMSQLAGELAEIRIDRDAAPFYMSADDPAVRKCLEVYNAVTGEDARPFTMGGGTYAREFPRAVSFGPERNDRPRPDFAGAMHGADEAASKAELVEALRIYILSLLELEKLEL